MEAEESILREQELGLFNLLPNLCQIRLDSSTKFSTSFYRLIRFVLFLFF